jgi:hypothetical protein
MKMKRIVLLAFLAAGLALADYNGEIGVQTTTPSDGTVFVVTGGPLQFTFDFSANVTDWNADTLRPKASLDGFRDLVASPGRFQRLFAPTDANSRALSITSNVPYQVVLGVPTVSGSTLPLSRYLIGINKDPSNQSGAGIYALSDLTVPTVVYTGTAGGIIYLHIYPRVLVYKNDLLPGTQTITIPLTVVPTP